MLAGKITILISELFIIMLNVYKLILLQVWNTEHKCGELLAGGLHVDRGEGGVGAGVDQVWPRSTFPGPGWENYPRQTKPCIQDQMNEFA